MVLCSFGPAHHSSMVPVSLGCPFASRSWKLSRRCQGLRSGELSELSTSAVCRRLLSAAMSSARSESADAATKARKMEERKANLTPNFMLFVIVQQAQDVILLKLRPPLQKVQFDRKSQSGDLSAK